MQEEKISENHAAPNHPIVERPNSSGLNWANLHAWEHWANHLERENRRLELERDFARRKARNLQSVGLMQWAISRMDAYAMRPLESAELEQIDTKLSEIYTQIEKLTFEGWKATTLKTVRG